MSFNDAPHARLGWLVIEKNASTPVDLDVYEPRCKDRIGWQVH
jgi:hypothetical protein